MAKHAVILRGGLHILSSAALQTYHITSIVNFIVAWCIASKKSASGFPAGPIFEITAPKNMEKTTIPSTFIPDVFLTSRASITRYVSITENIWAVGCDFQQCDILTCVDSDQPVQRPDKLRNSKLCSVSSSLTLIEYSSH